MSEPHGSRPERDAHERRRTMRDSRDQRYGTERPPRSEEQHDERFESQAGGRHSFNRDNEYHFNANRGRDDHSAGSQGRRDIRSNDDFYERSNQSDWRSRSYPQQGSFERAGYDSDREYWEGQRSGPYRQPNRHGGQGPESLGAGGYGTPGGPAASGNYGSAGGYGARGRGGPEGDRSGHYGRPNYREHDRGAGGYRGQYGQQDFGGPSGNNWEHGTGGDQPGQYGQQNFGGPSGNYRQPGAGGSMRGMRNRPPKGYTRSDERLKEDICERLMSTPYIDAGDVSVEVTVGKVVLEGTVPERSMKHRIEDIAEECSGVKDVENRIRVSRDGEGSKSK